MPKMSKRDREDNGPVDSWRQMYEKKKRERELYESIKAHYEQLRETPTRYVKVSAYGREVEIPVYSQFFPDGVHNTPQGRAAMLFIVGATHFASGVDIRWAFHVLERKVVMWQLAVWSLDCECEASKIAEDDANIVDECRCVFGY